MCSRITSRTSSRVWRGTFQGQSSLRADLALWLSHTSSIWPWSGAPKVRLYATFISGIQQIDQGLNIILIENMACVCKDGQLVIPKPLQVCAVKWYHHYLQHPGHTRLEEMMNVATKSCRSCQKNKRRSQKYGHLSPKTVYTVPW